MLAPPKTILQEWGAILRNKRTADTQKRGTFAFHAWIRESLYKNKPYDEFVRQLLTASGEVGENPPVVWYREVKDSAQQLEDTAQLFLGLRIQCARCHHHPFEKWSQQDYYGFSAFFSRVGRKPGLQPSEDRIFHRRGIASAKNPKTGDTVKPTGLGSPPMDLAPEDDPRQALVDWMAAKDNPFFAPALVNRYWKHFFSRGLVDPEDDMRVTNPASNPQLLSFLSKHFIEVGFALAHINKAKGDPANNDSNKPQQITLPCEIADQFYPRGDEDWYTFKAKKGDIYWIEALSQQLGLPTDPYMLLRRVTSDDKGVPKATFLKEIDDHAANRVGNKYLTYQTNTDDPLTRFQVPEDGTYRILIRDLYNRSRGNPRFVLLTSNIVKNLTKISTWHLVAAGAALGTDCRSARHSLIFV